MRLALGSVTRVVFVRHGESDFNEQGRFQGSSDEPRLGDRGRRTAARCGQYLSRIRFDAVLSSPLGRARETTVEILSAFRDARVEPPQVEFDERLREIHLPGWEGLAFDAAAERFPREFRIWKDTPHLLALPADSGALYHPLPALFAQARRFWRALFSSHRGQTVLAVSHGGAIRALLSTALGLRAENFQRLQQSNGGISALRFTGVFRPTARLLFMNQTQHLGQFLPKVKEGRSGLRLLLLPGDQAWQKFPASRVLPDVFAPHREDGIHTTAWMVPQGPPRAEWLGALGLDAWRRGGLHFQPGGITVLQYPRAHRQPVVQAINAPMCLDAVPEL